ncbi:MAG: alpha/beta hydrolase [Candidatus Moraniibacteriota bacterium]
MKKVIIVHGWEGYPEEGWFPWLKKELEKEGFHVEIPIMPEAAAPRIDRWVSFLAHVAGEVDVNTFFVGHSIGCQAILRYLESLPESNSVGGVLLVAPWFTLMNLETEEEREIAELWLTTPIDTEKVKRHTNNFLAVFSDDDDVVPTENQEMFEKRLKAKTVVEHRKGHFSGSDHIQELPIALDFFKKNEILD